jgi:plastocyanin
MFRHGSRHWIALFGIAFLLHSAGVSRACPMTGDSSPCQCMQTLAMQLSSGSLTPAAAPGTILPAFTENVDVGGPGSIYYYHAGDTLSGNATINVGDTVTWSDSGGAHTVTSVPSDPVQFDSGTMNVGDSFSQTFNTPGTYIYYCQIHDFLNAQGLPSGAQSGTITVLASPVPEPGTAGLLLAGAMISLRRRRRSPR